MLRTYEYQGFTLEVAVESDFSIRPGGRTSIEPGYVTIVKIFQGGATVAVFSPLRFGETGGRPFATEVDALMGGFSAARKIVDDLFSREAV